MILGFKLRDSEFIDWSPLLSSFPPKPESGFLDPAVQAKIDARLRTHDVMQNTDLFAHLPLGQ